MKAKYLVAIDGSDAGWKALDLAIVQASATGADIHLIHVVHDEPMPQAMEAWAFSEGVTAAELETRIRQGRAIGDRIVAAGRKRLREAGLQLAGAHVAQGNAAHEIVRFATDSAPDMVFLGNRGFGGLRELMLGSVSHKVAHLAPCACVIVK